jgi:hypothetical protein
MWIGNTFSLCSCSIVNHNDYISTNHPIYIYIPSSQHGDTLTKILNPAKTGVDFRYLQIPAGYMGGFLVLCNNAHRWVVPLQKKLWLLCLLPSSSLIPLGGFTPHLNFFVTDLPILRRSINKLGFRVSTSSSEPVNKCHVIKLSGPTDGYMSATCGYQILLVVVSLGY